MDSLDCTGRGGDLAEYADGGRIHRVDILQHRESYGGEVRSPSWLGQFVDKTQRQSAESGR
jgi:hypothetical protein